MGLSKEDSDLLARMADHSGGVPDMWFTEKQARALENRQPERGPGVSGSMPDMYFTEKQARANEAPDMVFTPEEVAADERAHGRPMSDAEVRATRARIAAEPPHVEIGEARDLVTQHHDDRPADMVFNEPYQSARAKPKARVAGVTTRHTDRPADMTFTSDEADATGGQRISRADLGRWASRSGENLHQRYAPAGADDQALLALAGEGAHAGEPAQPAAGNVARGGSASAPDPSPAARYEPNGQLYGHESNVQDPRSGIERLRSMWPTRAQPAHAEQLEAGPHAPDDQQWKLAFALNSLVGKDPGELAALYHGQKKAYEDHVTAQRAKAEAGQPVDQATAEQLVMMGVSPEAAMNMTKDSAALQLAKASPYLARGYRQDDLRNEQHITGELGKDVRGEQDNATKLDIAGQNNAARVEAAKARKKGGGKGAPGDDSGAPAEWLSEHTNVPLAVAQAFASGDTSNVDPGDAEKLQVAAGIFGKLDGKTRQQLLKGSLLHEQNAPDALQAKRSDPVQRTKVRTDLADTFRQIQGASSGWSQLSKGARGAAVKLALGGSAQDAMLSPDEQVKVSRVVSLLNGFIRQLSGAAVSESEGGRIFASAGFSPSFNLWKSPEVVTDFLKRMQQSYADRHRVLSEEYGGKL